MSFRRWTSTLIAASLFVALGTVLHLAEFALDAHFKVAAELDVGAAAGHVGGDGDGARHAGLRDDIGFLLVVAGVQDLEIGEAGLLAASFGQKFGFFDRGRADQNRLARGPGDSLISAMIALYFSSTVR